MNLRTVVLLTATCVVPAAAFAQHSGVHEGLKQNCTGDYLEHCSSLPPGGPEVEACFREKFKKLSPGCSSAIAAYQQEQKILKKISASR